MRPDENNVNMATMKEIENKTSAPDMEDKETGVVEEQYWSLSEERKIKFKYIAHQGRINCLG